MRLAAGNEDLETVGGIRVEAPVAVASEDEKVAVASAQLEVDGAEVDVAAVAAEGRMAVGTAVWAAATADCTVDMYDMASPCGVVRSPAVCHSHYRRPPAEERHYCKENAVEGHGRAGTAAEVCTVDIDLDSVVESSLPRHVLIKTRS